MSKGKRWPRKSSAAGWENTADTEETAATVVAAVLDIAVEAVAGIVDIVVAAVAGIAVVAVPVVDIAGIVVAVVTDTDIKKKHIVIKM